MLFKVALTPDIFELHDTDTLDRELDFLWDYLFENCLLFVPQGEEWIEYFIKSQMPQSIKDKTLRHLNRIKDANRIIATNIPMQGISWAEWALRVFDKYQLHAVITSKEVRFQQKLHRDSFIDFPLRQSHPKLLEIRNAKFRSVNTTEQEFEDSLRPILEYARVLRVVDPYINTKEWSQKSIKIASKLLGCSLKQNLQYKCKFEIYFSEKKFLRSGHFTRKQVREPMELANIWKPVFDSAGVKEFGHEFQVVLFGNHPNNKELHDRYILTDQCGVELSTGFTCDTPPHSQTWALMPEDTHRKITDMFVFNPPYPIRCQFQYPF